MKEFLKKIRGIYLIITIACLASILIVNLIFVQPKFNSLEERAIMEISSDQAKLAEETFFEIVRTDYENIDKNVQYIQSHYSLPKTEQVGKSNWKDRDDTTIKRYYQSKLNGTNDSSVFLYCLGLCYSKENDFVKAMYYFGKIKNHNLKYFNNSTGYILLHNGKVKAAITHFKKEIFMKGNLDGAYSNLLDAYLIEKNYSKIEELIHNKEANDYLTFSEKSKIYYVTGKPLRYMENIFIGFYQNASSMGFAGAIIILGLWLYFWSHINIFEKNKTGSTLLVCLGGMICAFACLYIYDFFHVGLGFDFNGEITNDALYCVFGIGFIEELAKITPFICLLIFTKHVKEPIDFIIYPSVSALGFAFIENVIYFNETQLYIMHGRALISTVFHMICSSTVGYLMMLAKYRYSKNPLLFLAAGFCIAMVMHGFFDFWISNEHVGMLKQLTFLFLIFCTITFNTMLNNSLNQSDFYDKEKTSKFESLRKVLFGGLATVFILQYLVIGYKFGRSAGNMVFLKSVILGGGYLLFLIMGLFSIFEIEKGKWKDEFNWMRKKTN